MLHLTASSPPPPRLQKSKLVPICPSPRNTPHYTVQQQLQPTLHKVVQTSPQGSSDSVWWCSTFTTCVLLPTLCSLGPLPVPAHVLVAVSLKDSPYPHQPQQTNMVALLGSSAYPHVVPATAQTHIQCNIITELSLLRYKFTKEYSF